MNAANEGGGRAAVRRIALAGMISMTGTAAATIAVSYHIFKVTGSAWWLSAVFVLTLGVTGLIMPFTGMLADRFDRRRLMIGSDLLGAALFVALVFAHSPRALLVLVFLAALAATPFRSAVFAAIPNLAGIGDVRWANSHRAVAVNIGRTVGPALGGLAVAAGHLDWILIGNAASFVISAALVASIHGRFCDEAGEAEENEYSGALAGFGVVAADRALVIIVGVWVTLCFAVDVSMVADAPLADQFHMGGFGFGLLSSLFCAGAIVGSFAARWLSYRREWWSLVASPIAIAAGYGAVAVSPWFAMALATVMITAGIDAVTDVAFTSILQRCCADAVRGRVIAAIMAMTNAAAVVAYVGAGALVGALGGRGVYALGAIVAAPCVFLMVVGVRRGLAGDSSSGAAAEGAPAAP
jgi:MFS family permease